MNRLEERYIKELIPEIMKEKQYSSVMQVPRLVKVVINCGVGDAVSNPKLIEKSRAEIAKITGQMPVVTKAKKSIAGFKLREGMPIGIKVTLRGAKMYDFLDKLINIALPRVRDFQGLSANSFDGQGNYTIGVKEQIVFPEINYEDVEKIRGLQVTIVTTAADKPSAVLVLSKLGLPFKKKGSEVK